MPTNTRPEPKRPIKVPMPPKVTKGRPKPARSDSMGSYVDGEFTPKKKTVGDIVRDAFSPLLAPAWKPKKKTGTEYSN